MKKQLTEVQADALKLVPKEWGPVTVPVEANIRTIRALEAKGYVEMRTTHKERKDAEGRVIHRGPPLWQWRRVQAHFSQPVYLRAAARAARRFNAAPKAQGR